MTNLNKTFLLTLNKLQKMMKKDYNTGVKKFFKKNLIKNFKKVPY